MLTHKATIPAALMNAALDQNLVIFAGAGISIDPPSNLPTFLKLAEEIAAGSNEQIGTEPPDQFLGRLNDDDDNLHQRTARILQSKSPAHNPLHKEIIRVFGKAPNPIRIVTTNFDDLLEQAAENLRKPNAPAVFSSPALPIGHDFAGIVHIHGRVADPRNMVLTHRDFGKAYLTEADGWARRFIRDLLTSKYVVLFVGYSHEDTIMNYLTPSLPPENASKKFALVGEQSDDANRWQQKGITPIPFPQSSATDFDALTETLRDLGNISEQSESAWKSAIAEMARQEPTDEEPVNDLLRYVLSDNQKVLYFTGAATSPKWIDWLCEPGNLNLIGMLSKPEISTAEGAIVAWLSTEFTEKLEPKLFDVLSQLRRSMSPIVWIRTALSLRDATREQGPSDDAKEWCLMLTRSIPHFIGESYLVAAAKACKHAGAPDGILRVYEELTARINEDLPHQYHEHIMLRHAINRVRYQAADYMAETAEPMLHISAMRLQERNAWDLKLSETYLLSPIEPHGDEEQSYESPVEAVANTAAHCLKWLAEHRPASEDAWCDSNASARSPIVQRLAIYGKGIQSIATSDDKIQWLVSRYDIDNPRGQEHHQILATLASVYPLASQQARRQLMNKVTNGGNINAENAGHICDWAEWLLRAAPDCEVAQDTLNAAKSHDPSFQPKEDPTVPAFMKRWRGEAMSDDEGLLATAMTATEIAEEIAAQDAKQESGRKSTARRMLMQKLEEECKARPIQSATIAAAMLQLPPSESQIRKESWARLLTAWNEQVETAADAAQIIPILADENVQSIVPREVSDALTTIAQLRDTENNPTLLEAANQAAVATWKHAVKRAESQTGFPDTFERAINNAAGGAALFWRSSARTWAMSAGENRPAVMPDLYRTMLTKIVAERQPCGKFGRGIIAADIAMWLTLDYEWTASNVIPLFAPSHHEFQMTWDCFLHIGVVTQQAAQELKEYLEGTVDKVANEMPPNLQSRFAKAYADAVIRLSPDADDAIIAHFVTEANDEMRHDFAWRIYQHLAEADEELQAELWESWLKGYWENRTEGIPRRLAEGETKWMSEWAIRLPAVFEEAVQLTTKMEPQDGWQTMQLTLQYVDELGLAEKHPEATAELLGYHDRYSRYQHDWQQVLPTIVNLQTKVRPKGKGAEYLENIIAKHARG